MNYIRVREALKSKGITVFSKNILRTVLKLSEPATISLLKRYKRNGYLKNPKRNVYFFSDTPPSLLSIAYKMYSPSYISFETALSTYGIIPEVVYSITSATTKATRNFSFENTTFKYLKIKTQAFTGYIKKGDYFIAEPEKALVDYLYFVAIEGKPLNDRIELAKLDRIKVEKYTALFKNKPLDRILERLYGEH